jgi:hypothetical protein
LGWCLRSKSICLSACDDRCQARHDKKEED